MSRNLLDRIRDLERRIAALEAQAEGGIPGTDQTVKASHDRLDNLLGSGVSAPNGVLVANFNADMVDGLHASEIAGDADTVDGFHASAEATANTLLALNASAKLPASITGDANTVDGFHASQLFGIWCDAVTAVRTAGSGTLGLVGPGITKSAYFPMADGATNAAAWTFAIPKSWTSQALSISVYFAMSTSLSAKAVKLRLGVRNCQSGQDIGGGTETTVDATVATSAYANYLNVYTFSPVSGVPEDYVFTLSIARLGADSADTHTGDLRLIGVLVKPA